MNRPPVITFLGAAGTVTGSRFLVDTPGQRVLVDCGQFQGPKALRELNWSGVGVGPTSIDAVVLTHAHVDHCGMLPALVRDGFRGPIFCTPSTAELAAIVLPDSGRLAEEEARYAAHKGYSKHDPPLPLFTEHDAMVALDSLVAIPYGATHERGDWGFRFGSAGHILGSAWAHLTLGDERSSVVFTGDLGRQAHPLLSPPDPRPSARFVVTESTYGNRDHPAGDPAEQLGEVIRRTVHRGGSVVIPAFAVDRTDVVLHHLRRLQIQGALPEVPVYLDSPMGAAALGVYATAFEEGAPDVRPELVGTHPFALDGLRLVRNVEESKKLNDDPRPMIIVSSSGMVTGGRVVHHVANRIDDERNTVVLLGYQASGTRGRRLLEGESKLKMLGRYWPVRAEVAHIQTMSVHADRDELVDWIASGPDDPDMVFAVHGEPDASAALVQLIEDRLRVPAVAPTMGERVLLT